MLLYFMCIKLQYLRCPSWILFLPFHIYWTRQKWRKCSSLLCCPDWVFYWKIIVASSSFYFPQTFAWWLRQPSVSASWLSLLSYCSWLFTEEDQHSTGQISTNISQYEPHSRGTRKFHFPDFYWPNLSGSHLTRVHNYCLRSSQTAPTNYEIGRSSTWYLNLIFSHDSS